MRTRISGKRAGQTLIEVAVATMIAAITSVAVFSVILSGFVSQKKADKKELAAMLLKDAQQTLQAFVSADVSNLGACGAGYCAPNQGGRWSAATPAGSWALAAGTHDISSLIAGTELCTGSPACSFTYTVTNFDCLGGAAWVPPQATNTEQSSCKTVFFDMKYAD